QSGLRQCELAHILAKKGLRRLAESVHRKAAALPQRNLVRIKLKNLLLGEAMLELKGDNDLKELALERALRRKEKFLRQLHRQRGRAAEIAAVSQHVMPGPRDHRVVIHSSMMKIPPVFNRGHGIDNHFRNLVPGDKAALGPVLVREVGNQQRLKLVGG